MKVVVHFRGPTTTLL